MKKTITVLLLLCTLCSFASLSVSASFGSGAAVIGNDLVLVKSALTGEKITFRDSDFKAALGVTDFKALTITSLPTPDEGTLLYAGRRASVGQTVKRRNVPSLVFLPASDSVNEARFGFTVSGLLDGREVECIMRFTEKVNRAPRVGADTTGAAVTVSGISICGGLVASDPEGDELEFIIAAYPKHGVLEISGDGSYVYTPNDAYVGKDHFTYLARDEWGNWSDAVKVSFLVNERQSAAVFSDMSGRGDHSAALKLTELGIMSAVSDGERLMFMPSAEVSRAEFVTYAMKATGIRPTVRSSFFDDDAAISDDDRPYVATAARLGAISGDFTGTELVFKPDEPIKLWEAARILKALTGISADEEALELFSCDTVPVYARESVAAMYCLGLIDPESGCEAEVLTRAGAVTLLYGIADRFGNI